MSYFIENWGSFVGLISLFITIIGFGIAIWQATRARRSAEAAETAAIETRAAITRVLAVVDLERAIALIERLKLLHRDGKWQIGLEHYQGLRQMLADIDSRHPDPSVELHRIFREAIIQIKVIEDNVDKAISEEATPTDSHNYNNKLNDIQSSLEKMASSAHFPESEVLGQNG